MRFRLLTGAIFVASLCAGCVFGPTPEAPEETNNGDNNGTNNGDNNAGTNNGTTGGTYAALEPVVVEECATPRYVTVPLTDEYADTAQFRIVFPPGFGLLRGNKTGEYAIAVAAPTADGFRVRAGSVVLAASTEAALAYDAETRYVVESAEPPQIYDLLLLPGGDRRMSGTETNPLVYYSAIILTSEGSFACVFYGMDAADSQDVSVTCDDNPDRLDDVAGSVDIFPLARGQYLPVLPDFKLELAAPDVTVLLGARVVGEEERIGAILQDESSDATSFLGLTLKSVENQLSGERSFAERLVWGIERESQGFPYVLMLAEGEEEGDYRPRVLRKSDMLETQYVPAERGENWKLSDRLRPRAGTFTFVETMELEYPDGMLGGEVDPDESELKLGYVGIDGTTSIWAPDRPIAGNDFFEFDFPSEVIEVHAGSHLHLFNELAPSPLAFVYGAERQHLAVARWDSAVDAGVALDVLPEAIRSIRDLDSVYFINNQGAFGFLARRDSAPVAGIVPVDNIDSLDSGVCSPADPTD